MSITIPPYLQKGDTIGIVAPAGYMPFEKIQTCIETLDNWGYTVQLGATTHSHSNNYFSGTDEERLTDLQQLLDDRNIKAILCARGGYGISRIMDNLHFKKFRKHPKWIIGFSDITALHTHVFTRYHIASLHAPMAAAFDGISNNPYLQSLKAAIEGVPARYVCDTHFLNRAGSAEGELVGGNLTLLAHLTGTKSGLKTKHRILFLEDIGEYLYSTDRMLLQLKRSGQLANLAGLIIGGFSDAKDTERPFGKSVYDLIYDMVKEYDYPVCFGFPVSHDKENFALKIGIKYRFRVKEDSVSLTE